MHGFFGAFVALGIAALGGGCAAACLHDSGVHAEGVAWFVVGVVGGGYDMGDVAVVFFFVFLVFGWDGGGAFVEAVFGFGLVVDCDCAG